MNHFVAAGRLPEEEAGSERVMEKRRRIVWIDVIKVFSTFLIVMQHSISSSFTSLPVESVDWKILNVLFMLSRMGVPIFIMCSGAGFLARRHTIREIWQKNIAGLVKVYLGWMAVWGIWDVIRIGIQGENANLRVMINAFLKSILFGKYHTWFLFMLLGLYAIAPFLYEIVRQKDHLVYYMLLSLLFTVILPVFFRIEALGRFMTVADSIHMQFVVGYSLYFVAGYYICNVMEEKWGKYAEAALLVSALVAFVLSTAASMQTQSANHEAYGLFSPCGFVMSVSLMVLFRKYIGVGGEKRVANAVASLQKYGIAVYLIHAAFVELWAKGSGIICVPIGILIWALTMGISAVVYRIPGVRKILYLS